jgi:uncharacterized protein (DUF2062 family)
MNWLTRQLPTRETVHHYRLLRPFASRLAHASLWRFTRRSVPRGVALGLFIAVIIPIMHTVLAAIMAIPTRANIAVTAGVTLLVNPLTIPPLYYAAYRVGSWELHHDSGVLNQAAAERVSGELGRVLFWIHQASGPIAIGILTIAVAAAAIGYFTSSLGWKFVARSRWRQRHRRSQLNS